MPNEQLKREIVGAGLKLWQVADKIGITDSSFSRKLRRELPDDEKQRIRTIIVELKEAGGKNHAENANH